MKDDIYKEVYKHCDHDLAKLSLTLGNVYGRLDYLFMYMHTEDRDIEYIHKLITDMHTLVCNSILDLFYKGKE